MTSVRSSLRYAWGYAPHRIRAGYARVRVTVQKARASSGTTGLCHPPVQFLLTKRILQDSASYAATDTEKGLLHVWPIRQFHPVPDIAFQQLQPLNCCDQWDHDRVSPCRLCLCLLQQSIAILVTSASCQHVVMPLAKGEG